MSTDCVATNEEEVGADCAGGLDKVPAETPWRREGKVEGIWNLDGQHG